ncbi:periplasmic heavy metal sensor [Gracilimonas sp.]|uniref:Spy/CpxP family protein refolding chaperone n=1 Tax=Gracilimonas sp. TaxID=1974203 RepID=UPI0032EDA1D2
MTIEKKYKWVLTGFIIMLVLNLAALTTIWFGSPVTRDWNYRNNGNQGRTQVHKFMQKELGLSEAQTDSISTLRKAHFGEMRKLRNNLEVQRQAYFDFIMSENSDNPSQRDSLLNELTRQYIEVEGALYVHLSEMKSVLNSSQQKKFKQLMRETLLKSHRRNQAHNPIGHR